MHHLSLSRKLRSTSSPALLIDFIPSMSQPISWSGEATVNSRHSFILFPRLNRLHVYTIRERSKVPQALAFNALSITGSFLFSPNIKRITLDTVESGAVTFPRPTLLGNGGLLLSSFLCIHSLLQVSRLRYLPNHEALSRPHYPPYK